MQSATLHRLGTAVSLAVIVIPVILAGIADLRESGEALGVPADVFIQAPIYGAVLLTLLKGGQAVATIVRQHLPEEGAGRHGLSTWINIALLAVPVALMSVMAIQDDAVMLGASPEMFAKASLVGGALLVALKGAQSVAEIFAQQRWAEIEEPVPTEGGANEPDII